MCGECLATTCEVEERSVCTDQAGVAVGSEVTGVNIFAAVVKKRGELLRTRVLQPPDLTRRPGSRLHF